MRAKAKLRAQRPGWAGQGSYPGPRIRVPEGESKLSAVWGAGRGRGRLWGRQWSASEVSLGSENRGTP